MEDDDERFPGCVLDPRCVLLFGHDGGCIGRKNERVFTETEYDALCQLWFVSGYEAGRKDAIEEMNAKTAPKPIDNVS